MVQHIGIGDIAPESVMLAGAGRAILLQLANPAVGYGVAHHSHFATDPLRRLHGTLSYIYALTNGTPEQRAAMVRHVAKAHRAVKATAAATHPAYDARDPQLQLWVAATLYDSGMLVYNKVFPPLSGAEAEAVYRDYGVLGTALGMPAELWPATTADFQQYWDTQLDGLSVDATIRSVAGDLLAARNAPLWAKALMPLARFLTAGLLPAAVREQYGFPWTQRREAVLGALLGAVRIAVKAIPARLRHAPMHFYLKRIPGQGQAPV
ncbi:oxygenase MpaB family protein [Arthrobacter sp. HY1533]|uniref:oxygenase MpaB family protein n=1 Tax=Arthrobacter sp. HY1533 TaxID=2970919 RepID=UPI0022B9EDA3|nr:oxygenase MpaB family protein [Arthrobacter sp. HY1533]